MLNDPVSAYLASLVARGISLATQRASRSDLVQFCQWWETKHQRSFDLAHLVDRDLRDWKHQRQQGDGNSCHHQSGTFYLAPVLHLGHRTATHRRKSSD